MSIASRIVHQGREARVSPVGYLSTLAITMPYPAVEGLINENLFSANITEFTGSTSGTVFFAINNITTSAKLLTLVVIDIDIIVDASGDINIYEASGTPAGAAILEPGNHFLGSKNKSEATARSGAPITGLTLNRIIRRVPVSSGVPFRVDLFNSPLYIGFGRHMAFTFSKNNPTVTLNITYLELRGSLL